MINRVIIHGRLGQDPETRHLPSGTMLCTFSIANSESYRDKAGNKQENTNWVNISCFGKTAELCQRYCTKGMLVAVDGSLQIRSYEDKSGNRRTSASVRCERIDFLPSGQSHGGGRSQSQSGAQPSQPPQQPDLPPVEDDLPF